MSLRWLLGKKRDEIRNVELYRITASCPMENYVKKYTIRYAGHVRRIENDHIQKRVQFEKFGEGRRGRGRSKKIRMICFEKG